MDFVARDRYRRVLERAAREAKIAEEVVEKAAIGLAESHRTPGDCGSPRNHVGYYFVGDELRELEQEIGLRPRRTRRLARWSERHATGPYLCVVAVFDGSFESGSSAIH